MVNIAQAILQRHPNADSTQDFEIFTDPEGRQTIVRWNEERLGPRPTDQQIQDAWIPALKAQKEADLIRAANADYEAIFVAPIEKDYILIRRVANLQITAAHQQKMADARAVFEALEAKIRSVRQATTEAEVEAVTWP